MVKFKKGDKVRCINSGTLLSVSYEDDLTVGKTYEVIDADGFDCIWVLGDKGKKVGPMAERFELAPAEPVDQNISTEFEIRWHRTKETESSVPMSGRVISRRATQQLAEDFITQNAGNYAAGEFSITQVTVLKRVQQVRRVKRVPVTTYKLEDA
ncbi:hypothetical protein CPT_Paku_020 [Burkholderia phage Paku]|uniref:Uncharacterized protein n=1 Tax=Burkholderia phage Paku TaxID=2859650 RepID=A0AAE7WMP6_9CAUD|nr:hypothetical protein CPT_Paku_020 [Burkholderia phage Paku]